MSKTENISMRVEGMTCHHCEVRLTKSLLRVPGVEDAKASAQDEEIHVTFDTGKAGIEQIREAVIDAGYTPV